jgi:hypothetical protein
MKKIFTRSFWATIAGLFTSILTALAPNFNFDDWDVHSFKQWVKLLAIILPIVGGVLSEFKSKKKKVVVLSKQDEFQNKENQ